MTSKLTIEIEIDDTNVPPGMSPVEMADLALKKVAHGSYAVQGQPVEYFGNCPGYGKHIPFAPWRGVMRWQRNIDPHERVDIAHHDKAPRGVHERNARFGNYEK